MRYQGRPVNGRWAAGIRPRNFAWLIRDSLAVSERPGGYARNHRQVRRQEEIVWLKVNGFTRVVSLLCSPHNLHAYEEMGLRWTHLPFGPSTDVASLLPDLYARLDGWRGEGERVLVHQEELGDRLMGALAGYLLWAGKLSSGAHAIAVLEALVRRPMGPEGRALLRLAADLRAAPRADLRTAAPGGSDGLRSSGPVPVPLDEVG